MNKGPIKILRNCLAKNSIVHHGAALALAISIWIWPGAAFARSADRNCAVLSARIAKNASKKNLWEEKLFARSRLAKKFSAELSGNPVPNITPEEFRQDSIWWRDALESYWDLVRGDELEQQSARDGRFWKLYGTLAERWFMEDPALASLQFIPGPAIRVGDGRHADGWMYHVTLGPEGKRILVIDGFVEMKAARGSYGKALHQVFGFVTRLVNPKSSVKLYGEILDRNRVFIRTTSGVVPINSLAHLGEEFSSAKPEEFRVVYLRHFESTFYRIILPRSQAVQVWRVSDYATVMPALLDRQTLLDRFLRFLQRHYDHDISAEDLRESHRSEKSPGVLVAN